MIKGDGFITCFSPYAIDKTEFLVLSFYLYIFFGDEWVSGICVKFDILKEKLG